VRADVRGPRPRLERRDAEVDPAAARDARDDLPQRGLAAPHVLLRAGGAPVRRRVVRERAERGGEHAHAQRAGGERAPAQSAGHGLGHALAAPRPASDQRAQRGVALRERRVGARGREEAQDAGAPRRALRLELGRVARLQARDVRRDARIICDNAPPVAPASMRGALHVGQRVLRGAGDLGGAGGPQLDGVYLVKALGGRGAETRPRTAPA
jgi:hypothetical protein